MSDEKISEIMTELVRASGDKVSIDTEECVLWKLEHSNCFGCSSELGCGKTVKLMLVVMLPTLYEPKDFEDFQRMHQRIDELHEQILHSQTKEELDKIPTV